MLNSEPVKDFTIKNGKLVDPQYEHDFHSFFEGKILKTQLLLPGIIGESILITTRGDHFELTAHIKSEYYQIYKSRQMIVSGKLAEPVIGNVQVANYEDGILSIEFVRVSHLDHEYHE